MMTTETTTSTIQARLAVRSAVATCTRCSLAEGCSGPIPFRGPTTSSPLSGHRTKIAIIGEAPGRIEDATRKPFVGPSGQLAEQWLAKVGIDGESVAWLNAVSCFPNRSPTAREVLACKENLLAQLQYLRPEF